MKVPRQDKAAGERAHAEQMRQRVRVGMSGLAAVVLLIGLASAIFSSVNREAPVDGAGNAAAVANLSAPGALPSPTPSNEPLAELGVTPAAANTPAAGAAPDAK
ncbi:MAG: hypothetical protein PGN23_05585 [Sphingomonas adhaesiva]|uniref:hypothetical protein n=1 Tax=Sphingomonas adhaesiva TaxID=28212 RepID=UPI002FF7A43C